MAKKSKKFWRSNGYKFVGGHVDAKVSMEKPCGSQNTDGISVSLKHYQPNTECFADWDKTELKKFSTTIVKLRSMSRAELAAHKNLCCKSSNQSLAKKLSRPPGVDRALDIFEIRLGASSPTRMFGVLLGSVFHLIWLDHRHRFCPA